MYGFQLRLDGSDVGVDQIFQQTALVRAQLLAALGKPMSLEDGDFVGKLLVHPLQAIDLTAQLRG
ncbi:hypothetical protein D9M68_640660 [compost metagenome]